MTENIAQIGDNAPPAPTPVDPLAKMREILTGKTEDLTKRVNELSESADNVKVTNEQTAGDATDLAKMIGKALAETRKTQKIEKAPHWARGRVVDAHFNTFEGILNGAKVRVLAPLNAYREEQKVIEAREQRRLQDEARDKQREAEAAAAANKAVEAKRLQVQAETVAKQAAAPVAAKIRSDHGALASDTTEWGFEVEHPGKLPDLVMKNVRVLAMIDLVIGSLVRSGTRKIEGVRIFETTKTVVR